MEELVWKISDFSNTYQYLITYVPKTDAKLYLCFMSYPFSLSSVWALLRGDGPSLVCRDTRSLFDSDARALSIPARALTSAPSSGDFCDTYAWRTFLLWPKLLCRANASAHASARALAAVSWAPFWPFLCALWGESKSLECPFQQSQAEQHTTASIWHRFGTN